MFGFIPQTEVYERASCKVPGYNRAAQFGGKKEAE